MTDRTFDLMDGYGGHVLIPMETPTEWLYRWWAWIVVVGVAMLAWLMWWSDATKERRSRNEQEGDVVKLADMEKRVRAEEQRAQLTRRAEAAMTNPLTLEEEMVSLHNLRIAATSMRSDSA